MISTTAECSKTNAVREPRDKRARASSRKLPKLGAKDSSSRAKWMRQIYALSLFNENSSGHVKRGSIRSVSRNARYNTCFRGGREGKERDAAVTSGRYPLLRGSGITKVYPAQNIERVCVSRASFFFYGKAISPETFAPCQVPLKSSGTRSRFVRLN